MENQELYIKLCHKFFNQEISDEESNELKIWLKQSDDNIRTFNELKEVWYSSHNINFNTDTAWQKTLDRIQADTDYTKHKTIVLPKRNLLLWKAAVILVLLGSFALIAYITDFGGLLKKETPLYTIEAPKGEKTLLTLTDGTKVWLNSGSRLQYSPDFSPKNRKVILDGEGYFQVTKNPEYPFTLISNETEVQVLGTKFNLSNYPNDTFIQLTLVSGSVCFMSNKTHQKTLIKPNEQLTYIKQSGKTTVSQTDTELYTIWKDNMLKFDNTPFIEVIKKLERWYDVDILLEPNMMRTESYTMTVKTESLREILEMLKLTTPFEYRIDNEKVYIFNKKPY